MSTNVKRTLVAVLVVLNLAGFVWIKAGEQANAAADVANTQGISQLAAGTAVSQAQQHQLAQAQQQQAMIFNVVLGKFFAEQAYLCRIASARAVNSGLEAPPPGICDVELPTPSPAPSPTPP